MNKTLLCIKFIFPRADLLFSRCNHFSLTLCEFIFYINRIIHFYKDEIIDTLTKIQEVVIFFTPAYLIDLHFLPELSSDCFEKAFVSVHRPYVFVFFVYLSSNLTAKTFFYLVTVSKTVTIKLLVICVI